MPNEQEVQDLERRLVEALLERDKLEDALQMERDTTSRLSREIVDLRSKPFLGPSRAPSVVGPVSLSSLYSMDRDAVTLRVEVDAHALHTDRGRLAESAAEQVYREVMQIGSHLRPAPTYSSMASPRPSVFSPYSGPPISWPIK